MKFSKSIITKKNLGVEVYKIFKEELAKANIKYNTANVRIYNIKTVGVQGDERTYAHPVEIELREGEKIIWNKSIMDFLEKLNSRIFGEVKEINRVVYVISNKNL